MVYRPQVDEQFCFVLMPFLPNHIEYFEGIIRPAVAELGFTAQKADDIYGTSPIIQDIWQSIWKSKIIVADVTGRNPNVNYELGICHALGIPTILLTQDLSDVPFDYRHYRCIVYDTQKLNWQENLKSRITKTLSKVIQDPAQREELIWPYDTHLLRANRKVGSFVSSDEAMVPVLRGISLVSDSVSKTYGPHGATISLSSRFGDQKFDRSGTVIAFATDSGDQIEKKGIEQAQSLTREVDALNKDGTKTAVLLFHQFVAAGFQALKEGAVPRELVHGMEIAVEQAVRRLEANSAPCHSTYAVAKTSAGGDPEIGILVKVALEKAGEDGLVFLEESPDGKTVVETTEGMIFDRGYISPRFISDEKAQTSILQDAYILLYEGRVSSLRDMLPWLNEIAIAGGSLLIIANDVEGEALETLILNNAKGSLKSVAVHSPGFDQNRFNLLEDIAAFTGGVFLSGAGTSLSNISINQLGRAKTVEVSRETTALVGGNGDRKSVEARAEGIRHQIRLSRGEHESERLRIRLANLIGRTCAVRIGGLSTVERQERKYRFRNALASAELAQKAGIVAGGGAAYWHARSAITVKGNNYEEMGGEIVKQALSSPVRCQVANAGLSFKEIVAPMDTAAIGWGFNAESRKVEDLVERGIVDPTRVLTSVLQIAFAHARAVLQTGAWDTTLREPPEMNSGPNIFSV